MISIFKHKKLTWIDLENPMAEEVKSLVKKYYIHPVIAEELLRPTMRSRVDIYKETIYLILHFPIYDAAKKTSVSYEIDFIIGKDFLITAHYKEDPIFYEMQKMFEVGSLFKEDDIDNGGMLAIFIIRHLYDFALRELDHIQEKIERAEENVFKGREKEMVVFISRLRRDILNFHKTIYGHESILNSFRPAGEKIYGKNFQYWANAALGDLARVKSLLENCSGVINSLHETNDSLLTDKVNDIMRVLTIMAFVTFPLMLFSQLFSMNTISTPLVGTKGDFWIIVGLMILSAVSLFTYFKMKKWL